MLAITRKTRFAAAHHFALPELSAEENFARFRKTAQRHGHNYEVAVTLSGDIDPDTGMVVNLTDLKQVLDDEVVAHFDFTDLNDDIPYFEARLPTLENLALYIWQRLSSRFDKAPIRLERLRVAESEDLYVEYGGILKDEPPMIQLTRRYDFAASHRLYNPDFSDEKNWDVFGKCNNPNGHGHNYELLVTVAGEPDPTTGMVVDLAELDRQVQRRILDAVDHKDLNTDVAFMAGVIPTAENIVVKFWEELFPAIAQPAKLYRLRLVESRNNAAEYMGTAI